MIILENHKKIFKNDIQIFENDIKINKQLEETSEAFVNYIHDKIDFKKFFNIWIQISNNFKIQIKKKNILLKKDNKLSKKGKTSNIYIYDNHIIVKKLIYKNNDTTAKAFLQCYIQYHLYKESKIKCVPNLYSIEKDNNGHINIFMEKINGVLLYEKLLKNNNKIWLKNVLINLGLTLKYLQKKFNFVHADLSTNNIMLDENNKIIIIDFDGSILKIKNNWIISGIYYTVLFKKNRELLKSTDLFFFFMDFFNYHKNEIEENTNNHKYLIEVFNKLCTLDDKNINIGKMYIDYFYELKKTIYIYNPMTRLIKRNKMYDYLEDIKKKYTKYKTITKEDIIKIRKRFEPNNFVKLINNIL